MPWGEFIERLPKGRTQRKLPLGQSESYIYDAAGNVLTRTDFNGKTTTYGYDSIYRLTSETIAGDPNNVNGAAGYVYDNVGNRTEKTSTIPGFPGRLTNCNANDQLTTDTYGNDGSTTASKGVGYVYGTRGTRGTRGRNSGTDGTFS